MIQDFTNLCRVAYYCITGNMKDEEVLNQIVEQLDQFEKQGIHDLNNYQNKGLHLFFRKMQIDQGQIIGSKCQKLIEQTNRFCYQVQCGKDIHNLQSCVNNEVSEDDDINKKLLRKAKQELLIIESLRKYLEERIEEKYIFKLDQVACQYKIDIGLNLEDQKVGIEISGNAYIGEEKKLIGKKADKIKILEYDGWKMILVYTGSKQMNAILGMQGKQQIEKMCEGIIEQIEQKIGRKLKYKQ